MSRILFIVLIIGASFSACFGQNTKVQTIGEDLEIIKISTNVYQHISYMSLPKYGKFPCNGMIYKVGKEVVVFDSPHTEKLAEGLLNWIQKKKKWKVKAVVINHFHEDCLGGLEVFHRLGIESYSSKKTQLLATKDSMPIPKIGNDSTWTMTIKNKSIVCSFFGEAHSTDNIVSWLPKEKVLFGGCMVKAIAARKGNLADANTKEWANTIKKIKNNYPDIKWVIPGHGKYGNAMLLDYTIQLFEKD